MSDIDQAISVTTTIDIDWEELGRICAERGSTEQAKFFIGFYEGVSDMQIAFIGSEKAFDVDRTAIADVYEALAAHIRKDDGAAQTEGEKS